MGIKYRNDIKTGFYKNALRKRRILSFISNIAGTSELNANNGADY